MGACCSSTLQVEEKQNETDEQNDAQSFAEMYPLALTGKAMNGPQQYKAECHWLIKDLVLIGEYPFSAFPI